MPKNKILITGSAGFIGFHLSKYFLDKKYEVVGIDNLNNYYDKKLKFKRNSILKKYKKYKFYRTDIKNKKKIFEIFKNNKFKLVINLAAQAGVQYSIKNPYVYAETNIFGFINILEACKKYHVKKILYASSSSIYGSNKNYPFKEDHKTDNPISLYAATKKSNELIANVYSHIFNIKLIGLRFFTVYGPWGRPDMSLFIFTKNILKNKKIIVYNNGEMYRDFTYIDDVVDVVYKLSLSKKITKNNYIFNISGSRSIKLNYYIKLIEYFTNKKAKKIIRKQLKSDVKKTISSTSHLKKVIYKKQYTKIENGIQNFVKWFKKYYRIK